MLCDDTYKSSFVQWGTIDYFFFFLLPEQH